MFSRHDLREIRKLADRDGALERFKDISLTNAICNTIDPPPEPIRMAAPIDVAFHPPAQVFGVPYDPACLDEVTIPSTTLTIPDIVAHRLDGGRVIGFAGAIDRDNRLFAKGAAQGDRQISRMIARNDGNQDGFILRHEHGNLVVRYGCAPVRRHFAGTAVFLQNCEPGNYGRFILAVLPQLIYLRQLERPFDYYVTADRAPWFGAAIDYLGLPKKPVFLVREVCGDSFETLFMLEDVHGNGVISPQVAETLRQMGEWFGRRSTQPPADRLYVSRSLSRVARPRYRVMANEVDQIERAAAERGFTVVYPETMSWPEQVAMFHRARLVAGPSGSGMLNAIFAQPGTAVLDIESVHTTVRQHARAYATTGKHYAFAFGALDTQDSNPNPGFRSWQLPLGTFHQAIDWLLATGAW
jgi:hypothetical protein